MRQGQIFIVLLSLIFSLKSYAQGFLGYPLEKKASISCDFCCYLFADGSCHGGIDYDIGNSTPILAAAPGKVIEVVNKYPNSPDFSGGYGNYVKILHDNGFITIYGHLYKDSIKVKSGQSVEGGEIIALSDNSGSSTGPHLHFEVRNPVGIKLNPYGNPPNYSGCGPNALWLECPPKPYKKIFKCQAGEQNPNELLVMSPGEEKIFEIDFKNTGTVTWSNNKSNPGYIELWSADASGMNVDSFLYHSSWISPKVVMTLPQGEIDPNISQKQVSNDQTARFIFKVEVPENPPLEKFDTVLKIYFIPALAGKIDLEKCWNGAHFLIMIQSDCDNGDEEWEECGKCGEKYRKCVNWKWSAWSNCQAEGECFWEESQNEPCGNCGTKTRVCGPDCYWQSWGICGPGGACLSGSKETQSCGSDTGECKKGTKTRFCNGNCQWDSWSGCEGEVGPSEEICDLKDNNCDGKTDEDCFKPVYCFYYSKGQDKDHFLKNDDNAPSSYAITNGGKPVFYAYKKDITDINPLFRLYNGSIINHMYTDSETEKASAMGKGYKDEGNIGFCAKTQISGTVPLYRCWSSKYSDHHSTTNKAECDAEGYGYDQITCYVWTSPL